MSDLLLHTIWTGHVFNLWIERLGPRPTKPVRLGKADLHPWALADHALREACTPLSSEKMVETSLQKRMPADAFGALRSIDAVTDDAFLHFFRLPAVRIECVPAIPALLGLSMPAADDTRAWQAAARWALDLMARGRLVPTLMTEGRIAAASWDIALDDEADARLLDQLERALPASAVLDQDTPRRALLSFLRAAVRRTAQSLAARAEHRDKAPAGWSGAAAKWAAALRTGVPNFTASRGQLEKLENEVARWTRPVVEARRPTLCFRLLWRGEGRWQVEVEAFVPRGVDVPPLPVAQCNDRAALAETPWAPFAEDLGPLVHAQLVEAAKVFPALARAVDRVVLDDAAAVEFVMEQAPALQEKGFSVLVPAGLPAQPTRIDLQLDVDDSGELGREALLRFGWQLRVDGELIDVDAILAAAETGRRIVRVGARWIMLGRQQAAQLAALVRGTSSGRLGDALRLAGTTDEVSISVNREGQLAALGDDQALHAARPPAGLQATLRPYQLRGLAWLAAMRRAGLGACLADDMGLGKTIQIISLILLDVENQGRDRPVLLVCPTSLVGNWRREIERFAPVLRVAVHHGGARERDEAFVRAAGEADVVITTYGLVSRDLPTLAEVTWRMVVLDEAQNVKNPQTAQAHAVRDLPADFRIALTGTPVENRLTDLWSIADFLNPGMLGSASAFHRRYTGPIQRNGDTARLEQLRQLVAPLLLRRCKTDPRVISDLPEKLEMKVYCGLTAEQAALYRSVTESLLDRVGGEDGMQRRSTILAALMRLKQICNHPSCLPGVAATGLPGRSGKLERLEEMLEEVVEAGERALVFTQFAEWGERLWPYLAERLGCEVLWLHGGTSRVQRDEIVERFAGLQAGAVLVLSLKAGGTGLNLVNASHVFHYDRWWNPAVENQATDRAFRIGQTRNVQVHKLICEGTLEESIDRLIESKIELAEGVLGSSEGWLTEMDAGALRQVVELRAEVMSA